MKKVIWMVGMYAMLLGGAAVLSLPALAVTSDSFADIGDAVPMQAVVEAPMEAPDVDEEEALQEEFLMEEEEAFTEEEEYREFEGEPSAEEPEESQQ